MLGHLSQKECSKKLKIIDKNIKIFYENGGNEKEILGIEPSAILGFKDDYPYLCSSELKEKAISIAKNAMMIEEFISKEIENGNISNCKISCLFRR